MMADMDEQALADIANELYAVPLEEFVAARTAAAKAAAGADKELAAAVKGLPKPSVAAWAVNMLAQHEPDVLAELADLGFRMRDAQASLDAQSLRELGRERRTMLASAVDTARSVVQQQGRAISDTIAADVEETLRALTADQGAAEAVRSGRLLKALSADGVSAAELEGTVAVPEALPAPSASPPRRPALASVPTRKERPTPERTSRPKATKPRLEAVRQTPRPASPPALEKAKAALAEAQAEEARTNGLAEELQEQVEETRSEIDALVQEAAELRERLKAAEEQLDRARKQLAATAAEAKQALREADKAGRTVMLARERVLRLSS